MGRDGGEKKERKVVCAESEEEKDLNIWIIQGGAAQPLGWKTQGWGQGVPGGD